MKITYFKKGEYYKVSSHDDLESLFSKLGVSKFVMLKYNKLESIEPGDLVIIPNYQVYFVKPADTLQSISQKFGVTVEEIKRKNKINNIFVGQILCI